MKYNVRDSRGRFTRATQTNYPTTNLAEPKRPLTFNIFELVKRTFGRKN